MLSDKEGAASKNPRVSTPDRHPDERVIVALRRGGQPNCLERKLSTAANRRSVCACSRSNALIRPSAFKSKLWRRTGPTRLLLERIGGRSTDSFWDKWHGAASVGGLVILLIFKRQPSRSTEPR